MTKYCLSHRGKLNLTSYLQMETLLLCTHIQYVLPWSVAAMMNSKPIMHFDSWQFSWDRLLEICFMIFSCKLTCYEINWAFRHCFNLIHVKCFIDISFSDIQCFTFQEGIMWNVLNQHQGVWKYRSRTGINVIFK